MELEQITQEYLEKTISRGKPLLLDLQASWCPQCGPQEGVLMRLAPEFEGQVTFVRLDVEQYPDVLEMYGVRGLPTLLLFNQGELRDMLRGFKRAPVIGIALKKLIQTVHVPEN